MGSAQNSGKALRHLIVIVAATGVILPAGFIMIKKVYSSSLETVTQSLTPESVTIDISNVYSSTLKAEITTFIKQHAQTQALSFVPTAFNRNFKRTFPSIKTVEWTFTPKRELIFKVVGQQPQFVVNNRFVATDQRTLAPCELFCEYKLDSLPALTIDASWCKKKLARRVYSFLTKIEPATFQSFFISYHKPSKIKLVPKKNLYPFFLLADEKSFFDHKKYAALNSIFADLGAKGLINKKIVQAKQPLLAFDLRFEKTITVKFFDSFKRGTGK